jgi:cytidine deaminase
MTTPIQAPTALPSSASLHALTPSSLSSLSFLAASARSAAYAPYSRFRVGAAVLLSDGSLVSGANIENASYPVGTCAERVALGSAITGLLDHGQKRGKVEVGEVEREEREGVAEFHGGWKKGVFRALAVTSDERSPISPCGMCRQL